MTQIIMVYADKIKIILNPNNQRCQRSIDDNYQSS